MSMSSRERMIAALKCEGPDRIPMSPYVSQGPFLAEPLFWRDQIERAERMLELKMDPTIDIWFPEPQPHPDVKIKTWRDTTGPVPVTTKEFHTPAGVMRMASKESDEWCSWWHGAWIPTTLGYDKRQHYNIEVFDDWQISRRTEPWVKGPEDLEKLRYIMRLPEGYVLDEWIMDVQRAAELAKRYDILLQARRTIVGDAFQWFCDINDFMCWMIEEPEFVKEFLSIFHDWAMGLTNLALEAGVDVVQRRGWYEIPTFWGVKYFEEFLVPSIQAETKLVHDAGKIHSYLLPEGQGAYADILAKMDFDVVYGIDPRMLHGGDMKRVFDKVGDKKSFWGGINAEVTVQSGDYKTIETAVKDAIDALGGNGGLALSTFIFPPLNPEGVRHMIDAWRKLCP